MGLALFCRKEKWHPFPNATQECDGMECLWWFSVTN